MPARAARKIGKMFHRFSMWSNFQNLSRNNIIECERRFLKPISHWDATSSRLFCKSILETVAKRSHGIAKCSHASRTGREHVAKIETYNTFLCDKNHRKTVAKSSHMSRTRRQRSQTYRKEASAICTMRQIRDINKTISRLNCETYN